jgi:hypothetical protein
MSDKSYHVMYTSNLTLNQTKNAVRVGNIKKKMEKGTYFHLKGK